MSGFAVPSRRVPKHLQTFMERAEAAKLITPEAYQSALNLMNPFPDDSLCPSSWPDSLSSPTLTNVARETHALSAPAGTATSWNFHAAFVPLTDASTLTTNAIYNAASGTVTSGVANVNNLGMFMVWTWKDTDPVPNLQTTAPTYTWSPTDVMATGSITRLSAAGIEAINVSTDLNRGGTAYAYRMPSNVSDITFMPSSLPANQTMIRWPILQSPPAFIDEFINYGNTYLGSARNGVVAVSTPEDHLNRFAPFVATAPCIFNPATERMAVCSPAGSPVFDWCTAGVWVTGLVPDAVFTLNLRAFFEYKPSLADPFSMSLAKPCTPVSPVFDELVSGVIRSMPAGFDYAENPFGEWMGKILTSIASVLPAISSVIPHPVVSGVVSAIAPGMRKLGRSLQGKSNKPKAHKQLQAAPPPLPPRDHARHYPHLYPSNPLPFVNVPVTPRSHPASNRRARSPPVSMATDSDKSPLAIKPKTQKARRLVRARA